MMGDYVTVTKELKLTQTPCVQNGGGKVLNLPDQCVGMTTYWKGTNCYLNVVLSGVPAGYDVTNSQYLGWCLDHDHYISPGHLYCVTLHSSLDAGVYSFDTDWPNGPYQPAFNYVNYLINTYDQSQNGEGDLQKAIWYFLGETAKPGGTAGAWCDDAIANGGSYIPGVGDWCLVICKDGVNVQLVGIEVDP
jgi:hypothetical protein